MRSGTAAAAVALTLALTACGSDEPEEVAVADSPAVDSDINAVSFDTLDANGDSYLDLDELPEYVDRGLFEAWDADADSEVDRDEIVGNAFELFDDDADGVVTQEEWETNAPRWLPTGTAIKPLVDVDADGDSELDVDEFSEAFDGDVFGEEWVDVPLDAQRFADAYFELYDLNDDGKVSQAEFDSGQAETGVPRES